MAWLAPAAFGALLLVAGPLLVHLLIRRHARRIVFPAAHFIVATRAAAVRVHRPADPVLLALRVAIVTAAVLAAAQPVVLAGWRERAWNQRTARAIVVDTSASVPDGAAARLADQEAQGVFASARVPSPDLGDAIRRATDWLETAPPARQEIVIVSDFQRGALDAFDLASVPPAVGIRTVSAGAPVPPRPNVAVDGWRGGRWRPSIVFDGTATRVNWKREGDAAAESAVRIESLPRDSGAAAAALRAALSFGVASPDAVSSGVASPDAGSSRVASPDGRSSGVASPDARSSGVASPDATSSGAPSPDATSSGAASPDATSSGAASPDATSSGAASPDTDQPVTIRFAGAPGAEPAPVTTGWIANAASRLRSDPLVAGVPLTIGQREAAMVVQTSIAASSRSATALVRAALLAARSPIVDTEAEPAVTADADLARWRRDAGPASSDVSRVEATDARWCWAAALALLAVEAWVRRRGRAADEREVHADAA